MRLPLSLRILARILPARHREAILGDWLEEYQLRAERDGRAAAAAWARRQALASLLPSLELGRTAGTDLSRVTAHRGGWDMGSWIRNFRYAVRAIRTRPLASAFVALTFALGIGLNTSMASTASQLFLAPLPYPGGERLVVPWPGHALPGDLVGELVDSDTFDGVAVFWDVRSAEYFDPARPGSTTVGYQVGMVTRNYFDLFGVRPALGRTFTDADVPPQDLWSLVHKVVLTHEAWVERLGADPSVVGRSVPNGSAATEIIGVMPPEATPLARGQDGWTAVAFMDQLTGNPRWHFETLARLAPGVPFGRAEAELEGRLARAEERHDGPALYQWSSRPDFGPVGQTLEEQTLVPLRSYLAGNVGGGMVLLVAAGLATLLVALVNASALALHRSLERRGEASLRLALGAGRRHILGLVASEQALLALAGGAAALALAGPGTAGLRGALPEELPHQLVSGLGRHAVLWAVAGSILCGVVSTAVAMLPFLGARDAGAPTQAGRDARTTTATTRRSLGLLLAAQVALVTVLLVGGGVLMRTVAELRSVEPGFETEQIVVLTPQADGLARRNPQAPGGEVLAGYIDRVLTALADLPFVAAVGQGPPPLTGSVSSEYHITDGREAYVPGERDILAGWRIVGPGAYFEALGVDLVSGRPLGPDDVTASPAEVAPAVVNQPFAEQLWGDEDPLDRTFHLGFGSNRSSTFRVVGVVRPFRDMALDVPPAPRLYSRFAPARLGSTPFLVRVEGDVEARLPRIEETFREVDPRVPLVSAEPIGEHIEASFRSRKAALQIVGGLATVGLALALLGIYGVTTLNAGRRSREIGIRMALGARTRSVLAMILGQEAGWVLGGMAVGLLAATELVPFLETMLFGVGAYDPTTLLSVPLLLVATTVAATLVPAFRASRLDPSETLRGE